MRYYRLAVGAVPPLCSCPRAERAGACGTAAFERRRRAGDARQHRDLHQPGRPGRPAAAVDAGLPAERSDHGRLRERRRSRERRAGARAHRRVDAASATRAGRGRDVAGQQATARGRDRRPSVPGADRTTLRSRRRKPRSHNAKLVYDQNEQLFKQGYVSQTALQNSQRRSTCQAQQAYNNASVGLRNNTVSAENVKAQQAAAQSAAAQANVLRTQIGQTTLYAPFSRRRHAALDGSRRVWLRPAAPVLSISRVDTVWININVPDTYLEFVQPGSPASLTSSSLPGKTFQVRVQNVNAVPTSGTLSYLARVQMPNPGDVLRGGMLISATIPKEQRFGVDPGASLGGRRRPRRARPSSPSRTGKRCKSRFASASRPIRRPKSSATR